MSQRPCHAAPPAKSAVLLASGVCAQCKLRAAAAAQCKLRRQEVERRKARASSIAARRALLAGTAIDYEPCRALNGDSTR